MATRDRLIIRAPVAADEGWVRAAHAELATEGFDFALGLDGAPTFADWVDYCARQVRGAGLPNGWVPHTFLLANLDGDGVARISVRHELNDFLRQEGGHIGYAVRPDHRRRGVASALLGHGLVVLAAHGWAEALVTCEDGNVGSATVIERAGGRLCDIGPRRPNGPVMRRYVVPTGASGRGASG